MGAWARATVGAVLATTTVLLAVGCGASSGEIVDEARARGGGLTGDLVVDAVAAVAERQGVETVALRSVTVVFTQVALEVGVPGGGDAEAGPGGVEAQADVDEVVVYEYGTSGRFGEHGLAGPQPMVRSSTEAPVGPSLFTLEQAGVAHFDRMVATALARADLTDGYASGATIARPPGGGEPRTVVTVTDGGEAVHVTLAPDGSVVDMGA